MNRNPETGNHQQERQSNQLNISKVKVDSKECRSAGRGVSWCVAGPRGGRAELGAGGGEGGAKSKEHIAQATWASS